MFKFRDTRSAGYVLAIGGVSASLLVVIVGASTIAALHREVPKELWAIGGALSGALVGILAPSPKRTGASAEQGATAAQLASNEAAQSVTTQAAAANQKATTAMDEASRKIGNALVESEKAVGEAQAGATAQQQPSAAAGAQLVVKGLQQLLEGGSAAPTASASLQERLLTGDRAMIEAALKEATAAAAAAASGHPGHALAGAQAAIGAARRAADATHSALLREGEALVKATAEAGEEVQRAGAEVWRHLGSPAKADRAGSDGAAGAGEIAAAQGARLSSAKAGAAGAEPGVPAAEAEARVSVHEAAFAAAQGVAGKAASETGKDPWAGLRTIFTEAKIIVPMVLFLVTAGLAIPLGLGVIHISGSCDPATLFKEKQVSGCSQRFAFASQAANVMLSLAAAAAGALIGIFASHSPEAGEAPATAKG